MTEPVFAALADVPLRDAWAHEAHRFTPWLAANLDRLAEVIGIPEGSIGERLYEAKVYLSSADLFAWTVVIIAISILFEKLFLLLLQRGYARLQRR